MGVGRRRLGYTAGGAIRLGNIMAQARGRQKAPLCAPEGKPGLGLLELARFFSKRDRESERGGGGVLGPPPPLFCPAAPWQDPPGESGSGQGSPGPASGLAGFIVVSAGEALSKVTAGTMGVST